MSRRQFATGAKVVVDICATDGLWLDAFELRAIAIFASGGGLERARRKEPSPPPVSDPVQAEVSGSDALAALLTFLLD